MTIPIDSILSTPPLSSPGDTFQKFIKAVNSACNLQYLP